MAAADRFTGDVWEDGITNGAGPATWHGAAPDSFMTHLALSLSGGDVEWGDHVKDDEYIATRSGEAERSPQ